MKCELGIDEAGRGSVIGNMFVAGVVVDGKGKRKLSELGVRDSKSLTPQRREELYPEVFKHARYVVALPATPAEIDADNLNVVTWRKVSLVIRLAQRFSRCSIGLVIVDRVGNAGSLEMFVRRDTGFNGPILVEDDADERYVAVSAASVVAKVLRDRHIKCLEGRYGKLGSGYPSDPTTKRWIREYYERHGSLPDIVRKSWRTLRELAPQEYRRKAVTAQSRSGLRLTDLLDR